MSEVVAILGGGQLAQMLGEAGRSLGVACRALDPSPGACAGTTCELIRGRFDDEHAFERLVDGASVVTFEFENVPAALLAQAEAMGIPARPGASALEAASDRLIEKRLFESVGMAVPRYVPVESADDLARAADEVGYTMLLKARSGGYDGRSQARVEDPAQIEEAWESLGRVPCLAEQRVELLAEVSVIAARSINGDLAVYPLCGNEHRNGILVRSIAPADVDPELGRQAVEWTRALITELDYVGVLALELFVTPDGLLGNEFAPRVHNTGHWTIEGAATSQFENHLRTILGRGLGPTEARGTSIMRNLIGVVPEADARPGGEGVAWHVYGKPERPGRKLGHVTVNAPTVATAEALESVVLPGYSHT